MDKKFKNFNVHISEFFPLVLIDADECNAIMLQGEQAQEFMDLLEQRRLEQPHIDDIDHCYVIAEPYFDLMNANADQIKADELDVHVVDASTLGEKK